MDLELEILILKAKYLELRYGKKEESHLQECCSRCRIECRYNENHDPETGRFTSGSGGTSESAKPATAASPSGRNKFSVRGFRSKQALNNHWQNGRTHRDEYAADGITTKEQYQARALELAESPVGGDIRGHMDKQGAIIRYDRAKNDFVKGHPQKGIYTMYKPTDGEFYYNQKREEDLKHGGQT